MKFRVPSPPITGPSIPIGEVSRPELVCLFAELDVCCAEQIETSNRVERVKAMLMRRMGALLSFGETRELTWLYRVLGLWPHAQPPSMLLLSSKQLSFR